MERKVGEIFEYNGEWYQCIHTKSLGCENCDLATKSDIHCSDVFEIRGECLSCYRKDSKSVIFKKLEKVGEPHFIYDKIFKGGKVYVQNFMVYEDFKNHKPICDDYVLYDWHEKIISIEIKQNKEDMEEKKLTYEELEHYYDSTCGLWAIDRDPKQVTLEWIVENAFQLGDTIPEKVCASNLKPFDLEAAKAGKLVCTRDGRKARIISFDRHGEDCPIIALVVDSKNAECEEVIDYTLDGICNENIINHNKYDLMMFTRKKEGWLNIFKDFEDTVCCVYPTEKEALEDGETEKDYITTIKIEWEE